MINQQFLSQCSDEQINKGVAWLEARSAVLNWDFRKHIFVDCNGYLYKGNFYNTYQPCGNPNDIMPIAFANGIGVHPLSDNDDEIGMSTLNGDWKAVAREGGHEFSYCCEFHTSISDNPLRAIAEVYILMNVNS